MFNALNLKVKKGLTKSKNENKIAKLHLKEEKMFETIQSVKLNSRNLNVYSSKMKCFLALKTIQKV